MVPQLLKIQIMSGLRGFKIVSSPSNILWEVSMPTNILTNSEPDTKRKGMLASPAVAFASRVLPIPGRPERMATQGIFTPSFL